MSNILNLEISFPGADLDQYLKDFENCGNVYHAHLEFKTDVIELKIFFNPKCVFENKFGVWLSKIDGKFFGKHIKVERIDSSEGLLDIDLSNASIVGGRGGSDQYLGEMKFYIVHLNDVKLYWKKREHSPVNNAEFFLNEPGFDVVKSFYSLLHLDEDDSLRLDRMNGMHDFYKIKSCQFRPEFILEYSDKRDSQVSKITKKPKFQFNYKDGVKEEEIFNSIQVVNTYFSFFYKVRIDYSYARIYLSDKYIIHRKILSKSITKASPIGLIGEGYNGGIGKFLKEKWQESALKNSHKLKKVVDKYIQAIIVDGSSEFLLRYNIIEICMGGKDAETPATFKKVLSKKETNKKYEEALDVLLNTIDPKEHTDFTNKWRSTIKAKMNFKPMKSELDSFLITQGFNLEDFEIDTSKIKELRDDLIHGSINDIDEQELRIANKTLYNICSILIMNLYGIAEWNYPKN